MLSLAPLTHTHMHVENKILPCLCCCLNTKSLPAPQLLTPNPRQCPREVKPKPERRELSQLLNLSTHSQHSPLKINHAGKPRLKPSPHASTHASHSAGSSLETSPPLFQEADVRMAAIRHVVSLGNVETMTLTVQER